MARGRGRERGRPKKIPIVTFGSSGGTGKKANQQNDTLIPKT